MAQNENISVPEFPNYGITADGVIMDRITGNIIPPIFRKMHNTLVVHIRNRRSKWVKPIVARLVLEAYSPLPKPTLDFASVRFKDGDRTNVVLKNLEWDFTTYVPKFLPGINIRDDSFVPVPGYRNCLINSLGVVTTLSGTEYTRRKSYQGYPGVSVAKLDGGSSITIGIHRLLALTFLEHPIDVSHLTVNHINSDITDFRLENLEWCTYSYNSQHAYISENRTGQDRVVALNVDTRRTQEFISLGECGRFFGVTAGAIHCQLNANKKFRPYRGYYIKYATDPRPWPKRNVRYTRECCDGDPIIVKKIHDGTVTRYPSSRKFAHLLGTGNSCILYQAKKENAIPYKGYLVRYDRPGVTFPEYTEQELYRMPLTRIGRPIRVTCTRTNETKDYGSVNVFGAQHKFTPHVIRRAMRRHDGYYNGFRIEYI